MSTVVNCWKCSGELEEDYEFCGVCGSPRTGSARHFKQIEDQFFRLRGQLDAGRMTRNEFDQALKGLMVRDDRQRYWSLGADSGKWYRHEGNVWVEDNPYLTR